MLESRSLMSSADGEEHISLASATTQESDFESVARKTVDFALQEATGIAMNGNTSGASDEPDGRRKVAFLEEAKVLVSPLNGAENLPEYGPEEEESVMGEKGTVIKVKIATEDSEKGNHVHLERKSSIEDPQVIKQALHENSEQVSNEICEDGEAIDQVTRENTRKNSLINSEIRMEIEEDEPGLEEGAVALAECKDKKRSTLPRNFKKAFTNNFKKIRDSTSKLTKKPEHAEKETVTTSHAIKLPSKSDISKGFSSAKRRLSKSLSMREYRRPNAKKDTVDEELLKPVTVSRHPATDEMLSLHSDSISHDSCANDMDVKKTGMEELAHQLATCTAHDHHHHEHHHHENGEICTDSIEECQIVPKKSIRYLALEKVPPPRPAEGPLLSPMEAKPFRLEDQEILLKRSTSHEPTTADETSLSPRSKDRKLNQRSLTLNISPTSSVNGNLDVNTLDPTRFDGTYGVSGTLTKTQNRKLYRTRSDLDKERAMRSREAHSNYIEKLRKRMSMSTEKAQTLRQTSGGGGGGASDKQMEVYERQEVYSFSFSKKKAPQLKRRHTMLVEASSAIQPLVARPKLQATLQRVNDPRNASYLDPKFKSATLQRQPISHSGYPSPLAEGVHRPQRYNSVSKVPLRPSCSPSPLFYREPSTLQGGAMKTLEVTDNEPMLKLPFENENLPQAKHLEELTPFAFQDAPPISGDLDDLTRSRVARTLTTLITSSETLKAADLQNEYSAFHWLDGKKNFRVLGFATGWAELVLCEENSTKRTFVRLPRIELVPEGIAYPVYPMDSLVRNWLERRTPVPTIGSETSYHADSFQSDLLQNCPLLVTLKDLLTSDSFKLSTCLRHCIQLTVFLSAEYVNSTMGSTKDLGLDLSPEHILICFSHVNCLVMFRIAEDSQQTAEKLMEFAALPKETELHKAIDAEIGELKDFVKQSAANDERGFLMKTLEAVSPPDWTSLMLARIGKLHL